MSFFSVQINIKSNILDIRAYTKLICKISMLLPRKQYISPYRKHWHIVFCVCGTRSYNKNFEISILYFLPDSQLFSNLSP